MSNSTLYDSEKYDPSNPPALDTISGGVAWALACTMISIPGLFLSPLLFSGIMSKEKLHSTANILVAIMSCTDFFNSIVGFTFFGASFLLNKYPSSSDAWVCHLQGVLYPSLAMTTFYILGLLTFERYRMIVINKKIDQKKALKSVLGVYLCLTIWAALPWITNNKFGRDELKANGSACFCGGGEGKVEEDVLILVNVCLFGMTACVMIYFYSKIYFHIKAIFGKVTPGGGAEEDGKKKKKGTSKETKILYQFITITVFFLSCWCVLAVMWLLNSLFGVFIYNTHIDGVVGFCCHLNSALNPLIYGIMNKSLRNAMYDMLPEKLGQFLYNKTYGKGDKARIQKTISQHLTHESDKDNGSQTSDQG